MDRFQAFLSALVVPVLFIVFYIVIFLLVRGSVPTPNELIEHFASLYERYGYEIIFLSSMLEGLVLINFVVPGATAVILGAIFAYSGQVNLSFAIISAAAGAIIGYTVDYFLGYFGFAGILKKFGYQPILNKAKNQVEKSTVRTLVLGFIHPNLGSFTSLSCGVLKTSLKKFFPIMGLSTVAWFTLWGGAIYSLGSIFLEIITKYFIFIILAIFVIWIGSYVYTKIHHH